MSPVGRKSRGEGGEPGEGGARLVGSNFRSRANALKGIPLSEEAGETTNKGSGRRPQPLGFKDVPPPPRERLLVQVLLQVIKLARPV